MRVCVLVAALASAAHAQPAGFDRFEVSDVTFTLRDDTFNVIAADPGDPRTAYVGTHQGRFYKTTDAGQTWTESTVIPEQKLLWATPGNSLFFGAIRDAGGHASADH